MASQNNNMCRLLTCISMVVALFAFFGTHTIQEGYVGVVYRFGSLSDQILDPGLHLLIPLITTVYQVQTTIQTDYIRDVPCGTNSGVNIKFDKIEVVNQLEKKSVYETIKNYTVDYDKTLIFDKINHEMNQFCSKHTLQQVYIEQFDKLDEILTETLQASLDVYAPGVTIRNIRLSKPIVPPEVEKNYKEIVVYQTEMLKAKTESERNLQMVQLENIRSLERLKSSQEQTMAQLKSDQEKKLAEIEANKNHKLAETRASHEKKLAEIETSKNQTLSETSASHEKKLAEIETMKNQSLAQIFADEKKKLEEIRTLMEIDKKTFERDIAVKKGELDLQKRIDEIERIRSMNLIDIQHYDNMKYAESQNKLMTREYVLVEMAKHLANNTKVFYGDSLPKLFAFPQFQALLNQSI